MKSKKTLNYGSHLVDEADIKTVIKVLKSQSLTNGKEVEKFEKDFAKIVKSKFALSCSNGTTALHLALLALKIKKGDCIIVPNITFIATFNSVLMAGATPIICDVDEHTGLIDIHKIKEIIFKYKLKIKGLIAVHLYGNVVKLKQIGEEFPNLNIIEDSCHSLGSYYYEGKKKITVGDCSYSKLSTFSFHPVKNITTGEGGMVTTNNKEIYKRLVLLRNHSLERVSYKSTDYPYNINQMGYNYRLSDIQCALGRSQLGKIKKFKIYRQKIFKRYEKNLKKQSSLIDFVDDKYSNSFWHLLVIKLDFKRIGISRRKFITNLYQKNIGTQLHYKPLSSHNFIKKFCTNSIIEKYTSSKKFFDRILTIPLHNNLKLQDVDYICYHLNQLLKLKSKF